MRFVTFEDVVPVFRGKRVAIVGSGPGSLDNEPRHVDGHEVVVRVSNYKTGPRQGTRCDVHYSFYGTSIKTTAEQLLRDGCRLLMCKLPNSAPIPPEHRGWHEQRGKQVGYDYRYIFRNRAGWWPAPVFVPDDERFLAKFRLLGNHQPTTGFSAILDVLECEPAECFLTGFDGFSSGLHNVNEPWRPGDPTDPIGHRPDLELNWLRENRGRFTADKRLLTALAQ